MKTFFDNIKSVIGLITVISVFAYLFAITFTDVKLAKDIIPQVLIAIVGFSKDIYNYFFGSSQGASKQAETIASMASNPVIQNSENTTVKT